MGPNRKRTDGHADEDPQKDMRGRNEPASPFAYSPRPREERVLYFRPATLESRLPSKPLARRFRHHHRLHPDHRLLHRRRDKAFR